MDTEDLLIESLASIEHIRWSNWMKYLFSKCKIMQDGSYIIEGSYVTNLQRQIDTPYAKLTEQEKQYGRDEACTSIAAARGYLEVKIRDLLQQYTDDIRSQWENMCRCGDMYESSHHTQLGLFYARMETLQHISHILAIDINTSLHSTPDEEHDKETARNRGVRQQ